MKLRKRYLIVLVLAPKIISKNDFEDSIRDSVKELFGKLLLLSSGFKLLLFDYERKIGVIRCYHRYVNHLRAAISLVSEVNGFKACFAIVKVTGTFRRAKRIVNSYNPGLKSKLFNLNF